ncbi:ACP S-malonyltransferase [Streptomyces sp. NPDC127049]|uniref:ACP S-malonyltransferase n=1 Tax=unclassified Streptomyces TaxID=2593676 RepID=UPI0035E07CC4
MTRTAFVFPGHGSQRVGMGKELLARRPDLADAYFRPAEDLLGIPLGRLCREGPARDLDDPAVTQPAVFLTSLITLDVLRGQGIEPDAVAGHSLGEYAALVAAGVLDWTEALWLVRLRGELVATVGDRVRGATAAVLGLGYATVVRLCAEAAAETGQTVEATGDNGPGQVVVSGRAEAVAALTRAALRAGASRVAPLDPGGPFHSSLLRSVRGEYAEALIRTDFREPRVPFVSSVTGTRLSTAAEIVVALSDQLTEPVRWTRTVTTLSGMGAERFVEVGPGLVLGGLIRRIAPGAGVHATGSARQLARTERAFATATV